MAATYIKIVTSVLVTLGIVFFAIGYCVAATVRQKMTSYYIAFGIGFAAIAAALPVTWMLPVTGSIILKAVFMLAGEIFFAVLGGWFVGAKRRHSSMKPGVGILMGFVLGVAFCIGMQIANVQPVLDTLQTAGLLKPKDDYKPETNKDCPANLQSVYNAFEQYADLNDKLPDAAKWQDDTDFTSRIPQDEWLHCPAISNRHDDKFGYALNEALTGRKLNLNGKPLKSLPDAATTPLLYDSTVLTKNAHDAVTSLPRPGRHGGRNNILYLDGHVAAVAPK